MAGKKIKVDFEIQQDSIDMLDYFKDKYKRINNVSVRY